MAYAASVHPEATVLDAVLALKDRLVGEPEVSEAERGPLEALLGEPLSGPASSPALETGLRRVCGVLVSSPMFMLWGLPPEAQYDVPKLTPEGATEAATCRKLAAMLISVDPGATLTCASEP
jgi:hypothetical protein